METKLRHYLSFASHAAFGSSLRAWLAVLSQNRFALHPFFIPKALFISCAIFLGIPFRWYERKKYAQKILNQKITSPVFIIGHPRSGTTFIHYLMSKDPQFAFCSTSQAILPHVFLSGSQLLSPFISKALPEVRPMDNLKMGSEQPKEEDFALVSFGPESMISGFYFPKNYTRNFFKNVLFENNADAAKKWQLNFDYFLRKLSYAGNGKRLLLKSPANTGRVKEILALYPDAKFIHIHRNPYEVYSSTMHLFAKMLPILSFQKVKKKVMEEATLRCYEGLYKKYNAEKNLIPLENLIEIGYKTFTENPMKCLEKIYADIQLQGFTEAAPFIEIELSHYKNYETNKFSLADDTKHKIAERWAFAFTEFGYEV